MGELLLATEAAARAAIGVCGMALAFFMENRLVGVATFAFGLGAVAHAVFVG